MALTVGLDILENPKEEENPKIPKIDRQNTFFRQARQVFS